MLLTARIDPPSVSGAVFAALHCQDGQGGFSGISWIIVPWVGRLEAMCSSRQKMKLVSEALFVRPIWQLMDPEKKWSQSMHPVLRLAFVRLQFATVGASPSALFVEMA